MKKVDVVLGLQWGDEGKGKVVDVLTPAYRVIARFQGGPNAGHSLHFEGKKYVLHTIPSGIFRDGSVNVIGNGVVVDPGVLVKEMAMLEAEGISCKNYAKWVTKLAMRLLLLSPAESSSLSRTDTRSVDSHLSDASSSSVPLSHSSSTLQPSESVLYVFKSLLYPTCADKAAYLLPYFIVFALEYHYKKQRTEENEHASTPRLVIPVGDVPLFGLLATFLNQTLAACDVLSDNETKHCGSEVLATLNTLQAWQLQSQQGIQTNPGQQAIKGLQSMQSNQNNPSNDAAKDQAWRGEMLRGFLGMIDRTQVVRVAKLLGQFEYALR